MGERVITPEQALEGRGWAIVSTDCENVLVYALYKSEDVAERRCADLNWHDRGHYEVARVDFADPEGLAGRVAELERQNELLREGARLMAETMRRPEPVGLLEGGPEVSERLDGRLTRFEAGLRRACHFAYSLQHELADEGHVRVMPDGTAVWAYGSKRMKNVSDELAGIVEHYFGGFNYPTD